MKGGALMSFPRLISLMIACALCAVLLVGTVSAASDESLTLTSSTVVDGDTNLSVRPVIELEFSGKVDELTLVSQNKDCFHLQDASGAVQSLEVIFPDVQVQTRFMNHVFLRPEKELLPGATYTLTIDQNILDKKGNLLGRSYRMSFTIGTDEVYARGAENENLTSLGKNILTYQTALTPASNADVEPVTEDAGQVSSSDSSTPKALYIAVPALILLLGAVGWWNYRTSRRSSTDA